MRSLLVLVESNRLTPAKLWLSENSLDHHIDPFLCTLWMGPSMTPLPNTTGFYRGFSLGILDLLGWCFFPPKKIMAPLIRHRTRGVFGVASNHASGNGSHNTCQFFGSIARPVFCIHCVYGVHSYYIRLGWLTSRTGSYFSALNQRESWLVSCVISHDIPIFVGNSWFYS